MEETIIYYTSALIGMIWIVGVIYVSRTLLEVIKCLF